MNGLLLRWCQFMAGVNFFMAGVDAAQGKCEWTVVMIVGGLLMLACAEAVIRGCK